MEMQFTIGQSVEFAFEMGGGGSPIGLRIVELTQAQYDAMQTHDANTLYAIPEVTD